MTERSSVVYAGFDPTADSLHVGHLVALMMLRRFQKAGHRPIALVGGATGMIGDPSGKSEERNLLSLEALAHNVAAMQEQMRAFLDFDSAAAAARLVNNYDWMRGFSYLDFLRDVGKNFPVNVMLAKDSVRSRLERSDSGLSFTEFSYMLLQAYDFVHLEPAVRLRAANWRQRPMGQHHGRHRPGAADARRATLRHYLPAVDQERRHEDGQNRVGRLVAFGRADEPLPVLPILDQRRRCGCRQVLAVFHRLERDEIEALDAARAADPGRRESQRRLAEEITRLVHGEAGLAKARARPRFSSAPRSRRFPTPNWARFLPTSPARLCRGRRWRPGLNVVDALVAAGLAKSKGDARRTITQGGGYVNNRRVSRSGRGFDAWLTLPARPCWCCGRARKSYALLRFSD